MAKKDDSLPPEIKARGLVENTTGVYRIPVEIKTAVEAEAKADGTSPADIVRQALARELERREYVLTPDMRRACGVG